ncbi:hypothetical protein CCY99_09045, partial [Helicobacter sp. 16-1353]|uniref:hypothetical protein n=1 Tax=Helicobacter sp. 16-1353 TaxID=2004996 RepID=UPI000DCD6BE2
MNIQKTNITDKQIAFFREFLAGDTKRYIFGHNQYSKSIINELLKKNLTIEAIVDDFTTKTFDIFYMPDSTNPPNTLKEIKIPIIKTQGLKKGKVVVVVVVTSQTQTALQKLESLQNKQLEFMDYFAFYKVNYEFRKNENLIENLKESEKFGLDLLDLEFFDGFIASINNTKISTWKDFRAHFWDNKNAYENIYNLLNDAESKRQFEKIVNFRLNSDFRFMEGFSFRPKEQYFEDFLPLKNIDIFFDIGAYKGESSLEFIKHNKNYKQIYFFEPER